MRSRKTVTSVCERGPRMAARRYSDSIGTLGGLYKYLDMGEALIGELGHLGQAEGLGVADPDQPQAGRAHQRLRDGASHTDEGRVKIIGFMLVQAVERHQPLVDRILECGLEQPQLVAEMGVNSLLRHAEGAGDVADPGRLEPGFQEMIERMPQEIQLELVDLVGPGPAPARYDGHAPSWRTKR